VGELARRTGLTVRALHHYDELGLLKPSLHTQAGYRLYTAADVARLQRVLSLRQLGFALEEIRDCLDRPGFAPLEVIHLHITRLRRQIELQRKLCERLEALGEHFRTAEEVSVDEFLFTIEVMTMIEKYYTPEQLAQLDVRAKEVAQETIVQAPQQWADLFTAVTAEMEAGTDPADPKAQELAKRWLALVTLFTGGDPGIFNSLRRMYENEDVVMGMGTKAIRPRMEYIQKAAAAAGIKHPGQ
jgi:DNA-binding transcriptional MerR regulator